MNFLPLILILFLLFKKQDSPILDFIKGIDVASLSPILNLLGFDESALEILENENFKNFLAGNGDIKSLIPMLLPLLKNFTTKRATPTADFSESIKSEYLSPIKDIASSEITALLDGYFATK